MKHFKLALIVCLGLGTALFNVGCSSTPAHQKLAKQVISLPISNVSKFQRSDHVKDSDVMSQVTTAATKCYVDSAKKLGDKQSWAALGNFVGRAVDATKGKTFSDPFDARIAINKAYQAMEKDKGKAYAKSAGRLLRQWGAASHSCVASAIASAQKKLQG